VSTFGVRPNSPPHDDRAREPTVVEVGQQRGEPAVELGQLAAHLGEVVLVGVPARVVDRHVRHALLYEPARDEARLPELRAPVPVAQRVGLGREVERARAGAEDQLVRLLLGPRERAHRRVVGQRLAQRVEPVEARRSRCCASVIPAAAGPSTRNRGCDGSPRGEGPVPRAEEAASSTVPGAR
jgi:hypothetical protein